MADSNIRISLELADAAAQKALTDFISKAGQADKATEKLKETGAGTFSDIALHIGKATGAYEIFAGNIAANVAIKAIEVLTESATKLFEVFVVDGVKAAEANQDAINSLNFALSTSGKYTKDASKDFRDFAEDLQKTTTFSHTAILANAALIESFTQLDTDGLKRATKAALDLSAASGKDLPAASALLAKAAEGNVTALHKMGVEVEKGRDNAETFQNALEALEAHFGGAAESKIHTFSGAIAQASHAFEDMTEQIGNAIVQNPVVIAIINELTQILESNTFSIRNAAEGFKLLVADGLIKFLEVSKFVVEEIDLTVRGFQTLYGVLQALTLAILPIDIAIRAMSVGLSQAMEEADKFIQNTGKNLTALGENGRGSLHQISTGIGDLEAAAKTGLTALANGADGTVEPINRSSGSVKKLSEELKGAEDRAKAFALSLIKAGEEGKVAAGNHLALAKEAANAENAVNEELVGRQVITKVEFEKRKQAIEKQYEKTASDARIDELAKQNAQVEFAYEHDKISDQEYYAAKKQLRDQFEATSAKADQQAIARDANNKRQLHAAEVQLQAQKVGAVASTFDALSTLTSTKNKELFEIGKAASLAAALIHSYQAIVVTMASVPYPFNIPLAIAQGIAGAVQVANIASTNPSFEQGGIVPGSSYTGDNVVANVNSGEMILNRSQQTALFALANKQNSSTGSSNVESLLAHLIAAVQNQAIVVNIGGKTIVDTVRSELKSGRTFA